MQRSNENRTEDITESVEVKKRKAFDAEKDDSSADEGVRVFCLFVFIFIF